MGKTRWGKMGATPGILYNKPILNRYKSLDLTPMAARVEIYTWRFCPFCIRAKALLDKKNVPYTEHAIDGDNEARDAMAVRAEGRRSVPQIFINDEPLGGCDDLYALERQGQLDALLAA